MKFTSVLFTCFVLLFIAIPQVNADTEVEKVVAPIDQQVQVSWEYQQQGTPSGSIQSHSPIISYYIKLSDTTIFYDIEMYVNDHQVSAQYNENTGVLTYQASNLSGQVDVRVELRIKREQVQEVSWNFTVDHDAIFPFLDKDRILLDTVQREGMQRANQYRSRLGLLPFSSNVSLQEPAQAHANYIQKYPETGHSESRDRGDLFTGETVGKRSSYFGYRNWYVGEGITYEEPGGRAAIDSLFDAPYHRLSIMNPFFNDIGTGYNKKGDFVINFGGTGSLGEHKVVTYPYHGQTDAKVSWYAYESPNPLRFVGKDKIWVGYPISYTYYGPTNDNLVINDSKLYNSDGEQVPVYEVLPEMEETSKHHVFLLPKNLLKPGETYTVRVDAQVRPAAGSSFDVSREWSFRTSSHMKVRDIYFENQNETPFLKLEWNSGVDPDAVITLTKDQENYLKLENQKQMMYKDIESGRYIMTIDSPHFDQVKSFELTIEKDENVRYSFGSIFHITSFSEQGAGEDVPLYDQYGLWETKESTYDQDKTWTVEFNSPMKQELWDNQHVYVVNHWGEKVGVILQPGSEGRKVKVLPPQGGYMTGGTYTLVITPLISTQNNQMTNGIQMPFTIN